MLKIAHRGYTKHHEDNSLEAFQEALIHNFDMIELDIQLTKDDEIIIFHDQFIENHRVNNMTLQEIHTMYPKVLLLSTFFDQFDYKKIALYFDLKGSDKLSYKLHEFLIIHNIVLDKIWFASFNTKHLDILRTKGDYKLGLISDNIYNKHLLRYFITKYDISFICFSWTVLDKESIEYLNSKGVSTFIYTLKDENILPIVQEYNICGIVSDILF